MWFVTSCSLSIQYTYTQLSFLCTAFSLDFVGVLFFSPPLSSLFIGFNVCRKYYFPLEYFISLAGGPQHSWDLEWWRTKAAVQTFLCSLKCFTLVGRKCSYLCSSGETKPCVCVYIYLPWFVCVILFAVRFFFFFSFLNLAFRKPSSVWYSCLALAVSSWKRFPLNLVDLVRPHGATLKAHLLLSVLSVAHLLSVVNATQPDARLSSDFPDPSST